MRKYYYIILLQIVALFQLRAQDKLILCTDSGDTLYAHQISGDAIHVTDSMLNHWRNEGFLEASADIPAIRDEDFVYQQVHLGPVYLVSRLNGRAIDPLAFSLENQKSWIQSALDSMADNGYPLANASLDFRIVPPAEVHVNIALEQGRYIEFGGIVSENSPLSPEILSAILEVNKGAYSQEKVRAISEKIRWLDGLRLTGAPEPDFQQGKCIIRLPLERERVSQVNGILGFAGSPLNQGIYGEVRGELGQMFRHAHRLNFYYNQTQNQTRTVDVSYHAPYMNGHFGGGVAFYLVSNPQFSRTQLQAGITYSPPARYRLGVEYQRWDNNAVTEEQSVSHFMNMEFSNYIRKSKDRWNISAEVGVGRNVLTFSGRTRLAMDIASKEWNRGGLTFHMRTAYQRLTGRDLTFSEFFPIGGSDYLTGYPPNFVFTDEFAFAGFYPGYRIGSTSHFHVIMEQGAYGRFTQLPFSAGIGWSVLQENGIIRINFVANKDWKALQNTPFLLSVAYENLF